MSAELRSLLAFHIPLNFSFDSSSEHELDFKKTERINKYRTL